MVYLQSWRFDIIWEQAILSSTPLGRRNLWTAPRAAIGKNKITSPSWSDSRPASRRVPSGWAWHSRRSWLPVGFYISCHLRTLPPKKRVSCYGDVPILLWREMVTRFNAWSLFGSTLVSQSLSPWHKVTHRVVAPEPRQFCRELLVLQPKISAAGARARFEQNGYPTAS